MCKILKVSRSGHYKYLAHTPSKREIENEVIKEYIQDIHSQFKQCYGYRRIKYELDAREITVNHKRVYRLMKECSISSKHPRKKHGNYKKVKEELIKNNLLMQNFSAEGKNKTWVGDITYIPTNEGFLYLMAYMDAYSRKIVGWSMDKKMREQLVIDALESAIGRENPKAGLIVHTDRGSQFIGKRYQSEIERHGIISSVSKPGNHYDNAIMESFNKSLKTEMLDNRNIHDTIDYAKKAIFEHIELFYNRKRRHSALGYVSPIEFENLNPTK